MMREQITRVIKDDVVDTLSGMSIGEEDLCEEHDISMEELQEIMVDAGYEKCSACGDWLEDNEFADDEGDKTCYSCRGTN
jgi:hypothetical protein